jgi:hypothetical protein
VRLGVRWTRDEAETSEHEFLARLVRTGEHRVEIPGGGPHANVRLDIDAEGEPSWVETEPYPTDLSGTIRRYEIQIIAPDGRFLRAPISSEFDAPLVPEDAPKDLVDALRRAWKVRPPRGRPGEQTERIESIIAKARELGGDLGADSVTNRRVARELGRVNEWGEPTSDYNRDVKAHGGWAAVRHSAGI